MSSHHGRPRLTPWRRRLIDRLLDQLLEADADSQARQLARLRASHPRIALWLAELLEASVQPGDYLETLFQRAGEAVSDAHQAPELSLPPGTRLGPWRIVNDAGRGGMGTVYRAERADGAFVMNAAIKLIRTQRKSLDERLKLERELLARLDHRHIARLIDGGTTEDDQAYLVMEWVEGRTLEQYLQHSLAGLSERLDLFEQIAGAVAHAHQRRVVHGDLKPGNVMVTAEGQARVVDFGVGRLLGDDAAKPTNQVRGLTPAFSAPEQRAGEEASTQSDVWALGRILHWLLEEDGGTSTVQSTPALLAQGSVARRADLAAILDRAGATRPDDRYAGVIQLLDDVCRYRQRLPVSARPASRVYHSTRFVQRHWLAVGFGVAAVTVLCLTVAGAMWQAQQAKLERDRASLEAARALTAEQDSLRLAQDLQQVVAFQTDQLARIDSADMGERLREDIIARYRDSLASAESLATENRDSDELAQALSIINFTDLARASLDQNIFSTALDTIDAQFADQPVLRANLLQTVAISMRKVGLRERALAPQKQALAIRRDQLGDDHRDTLSSIEHLGLMLGRLGRRDDQAMLYREALAGYRRTVGDRHARTLNAMSNLGTNYNARGEIEQAERYFREALAGQRDVLGPDHHETLITTYGLGHMLSLQGRHEESLPYHQATLSGRRQLYGDSHPRTLAAMNNMGALLIAMGRLDDALPFYQQALEGRRNLLGNEHRSTLQSINNMGHLLSQMERFDQARPLVLEALERARALLGEDHPNTLIYFNNAGRLHLNMDLPVESEQLYRQAVEGARAALPPGHWHTASFLAGHAGSLKELERFEEAEASWLEAYEIFDNVLGRDHERTLSTAADLAELYQDWNHRSAGPERETNQRAWQARSQPELSASEVDS